MFVYWEMVSRSSSIDKERQILALLGETCISNEQITGTAIIRFKRGKNA